MPTSTQPRKLKRMLLRKDQMENQNKAQLRLQDLDSILVQQEGSLAWEWAAK